MNPHDHDPELIMAIAEGATVSDAERTAVAECPECAADLAAQFVALAALHGAPAVALTELESARLLRRLDVELGHDREPAPDRSRSPRRRLAWAPVFSAAAVILALVLVAPALNLLGGGGDEAAESPDMLAFGTTTTMVASGDALELAPAARVQDAVPETGAADAAGPSTTVAAADGGAQTTTTAAILGGDLDSPPTLTELRSIVEDVALDPELSREYVAEIWDLTEPVPGDDPDACVEQGVAEVGPTVASFTLGSLVVSPEPAPGGEPGADRREAVYATVTVHRLLDGTVSVVAHDPITCRPLATSP